MKPKHTSLRIFAIVLCNYAWSSPKPSLHAVSDLYVVDGDGYAFEHRVDNEGRQWKRKMNLKRLELLSNDVVLGLPFDSCLEDKLTNIYDKHDEQTSKFEEIHQHAGFHHVHRNSMAVRPHCMFDVVVPFHNSSQEARIPGEFCTPEHVTGGAAVGDYDGDGMDDIYFTVFHGRSVLYRNNGQFGFDCLLELRAQPPYAMMPNRTKNAPYWAGDGTFTDVTVETDIGPSSHANGAVWADFDQDGDLDLYVTTLGDTRHYLYINHEGHFREEAMQRNCSMQTSDKRKLSGMTPNVGDFDQDKFVDIYVTEWLPHTLGKPSTSRLLRNRGYEAPGYFEDVTLEAGVDMDNSYKTSLLNQGTYTFGSSFTDFDNDGWQELLVTGDYGSSKMFWNMEKNFSECTKSCGLEAKQDAMGHAIGDWDNDGYLDWFSSAIWHNRTDCSVFGCKFESSGNVLFRNLGGRRFEEIAKQAGVTNGGWGWGAAFVDFDNNGFLDIIMTSGIDFPTTTTDDHFRANSMYLWQNLGAGHNGTTREVSALYGLNGTGQGRGLLKWDYDDDGDEDIIVCNNVGAPFFYQNQQNEPNNWIRIRVVHRCLSHYDKLCDSLGARVKVISRNNHTQTQEIGSSTHYLGQSSLAAHFGLGRESGNVTVKVTWPSSFMDVTYANVIPNTRIRIIEPERYADSGKTFPYSSLGKCFTLKVTEIIKQPPHATVTVNPDGKTVSFQLKPGTNTMELTTEIFEYSVTVTPSPGQPLTANNSAYLVFFYQRNYSYEEECKDGRKIGPNPTVTDERRLDGTSYNKHHVWWGAAMEDVTRDVPAMYPDGIALPSGTCTPEEKQAQKCRYIDEVNGFGSHRPPPRIVSNSLFKQTESKISARRLSDLHSHFGQFLAHDTDFSSPLPRYEFQGVVSDVWLPIIVPKGDVHFDPLDKGNIYLPFVRSTYNRCTGRHTDTPRQQVNKLTSYIDGSVVYGDSEIRNRALREFKDGKMKLGPDGLIPHILSIEQKNTMAVANDNPLGRDADSLLAAGDSRANVQPMLIAFHTLFVREHNRLCDEFKNKYPQATDEQLFQAARRLVAAELQAITFREYLPALLGGTDHIPPYQRYNESVNVGMSNIMATAAFRFGHSQVNTHLWRLEEDGTMSQYGHLPLRDAYFSPERVSREGGIDPVLRGAVKQAAQEIDLQMVDDMRNVLFPSGHHGGLDLASMNIQRGRDHGLPDYNSVRKAFGLKEITSFADITNDSNIAHKFEDLYQHRDNVDLWVAGLAEEHEHGSELGQTFRTIVMRNFLRIRDGDRFWYERFLSEEEIDKVHSLTLGKIIRLNSGYKSAPDNVFFSMEYCAGVENFQCLPHNETRSGSCENMQQKLRSLQHDLNKSKQACDAERSVTDASVSSDAIDTVLIVLCVLFFLLAVLFLFLFLRVWLLLRRNLVDNGTAQKDVGLELRINSKKDSIIHQNKWADFITSQ